MPDPRQQLVEEARRFAGRCLGPASERVMAAPAVQALFLSRVRNGAALEDAVLAMVHGAMGDDRQVADEFLAYFLDDVLRTGRPMLSRKLRTFLDTCDLAQSVFGDLWPQISSLSFESRAQFLSLLRQRLSWKASTRARGVRAAAAEAAETPEVADDAPSPERVADLREEEERMILAMVRLPERDRALLEAHLRGEKAGDLARRFALSPEAAKKALTRAKQRAQRALRERSTWRDS